MIQADLAGETCHEHTLGRRHVGLDPFQRGEGVGSRLTWRIPVGAVWLPRWATGAIRDEDGFHPKTGFSSSEPERIPSTILQML